MLSKRTVRPGEKTNTPTLHVGDLSGTFKIEDYKPINKPLWSSRYTFGKSIYYDGTNRKSL